MALVTLVLLSMGMSQSAWADTTYTYHGAPFYYNGSAYGLSGAQGSFTVGSPLANSSTTSLTLSSIGGTITAYSFTDGHVTWNTGNSVIGTDAFGNSDHFSLTTDASGNIVGCDLNIINTGAPFLPYPNSTQGAINTSWNGSAGQDGTNIYNNYDAYSIYPNQWRGLGTWTQTSTPAPVPEPTSLLLLGTGLIGGAGALRRKIKS